MAQVVQNLPSKFKDLSSNPSTTKGREKEKKKTHKNLMRLLGESIAYSSQSMVPDSYH
jgi:hypothetical protein